MILLKNVSVSRLVNFLSILCLSVVSASKVSDHFKKSEVYVIFVIQVINKHDDTLISVLRMIVCV